MGIVKPVSYLDELTSRLKGKAKVLKIDVDRNPQAASYYNVRSVSTLIYSKRKAIFETIWSGSNQTISSNYYQNS